MPNSPFIPKPFKQLVDSGSITCQSPSNIALVKYWGKRDVQIPENTSISFTLNSCKTTTTLHFQKKEAPAKTFDFEVYLDGKREESFEPKIEKFFERIKEYVPFLKQYFFKIETSNSFPHSSGIASSASGMSALALCLVELEKDLVAECSAFSAERIEATEENKADVTSSAVEKKSMTNFHLKKASFLSRLGSGSASRSLQGPMMIWGEHQDIEGSSNEFAIQHLEIHDVFKDYQDTILLVDKGEKQVSSTVGHQLMHGHPYAEQRFKQAQNNMMDLLRILKAGDLKKFIKLVESEALTLHSMMMTSNPYFILMKPNTLEIINKIWAFRKETNLNLCFTLDAGANVHLLYPKNEAKKTLQFIKSELVAYCKNAEYLCDCVGRGASIMNKS